MATERFIDLEHLRYADIPVTRVLPPSTAAAEQARAERQEAARARLRRRVRQQPGPRVWLTLSDLTDLLILLGEDDW
jgi:hypothetical protein